MSIPALVSVVVTTYNRSDALLAVLQALSCQTDKYFEVVVADDGSRPEHVAALLAMPVLSSLRLRHVWHPDVGFTASRVRNLGVRVALGDYLIFLDGDCVPERDFVAQHRRLAETGCFVNGSRVLLSQTFTQQALGQQQCLAGLPFSFWVRQWWAGSANKLTGQLRLPDLALRVRPGFSWKGIRSCNMGVWRSDFEQVDGFDTTFVGWGHEDADFVLRLHHAGVARKNGFCATEVYHLWHTEAARHAESANAQTVRDRACSPITRAAQGYALTSLQDAGVVVTTLG